MVWHTTDTLADIESGGNMGMALSTAKLFLVFVASQSKKLTALGLREEVNAGICIWRDWLCVLH